MQYLKETIGDIQVIKSSKPHRRCPICDHDMEIHDFYAYTDSDFSSYTRIYYKRVTCPKCGLQSGRVEYKVRIFEYCVFDGDEKAVNTQPVTDEDIWHAWDTGNFNFRNLVPQPAHETTDEKALGILDLIEGE